MSPRRLFFIVSVVVLPVLFGLALLWSWTLALLDTMSVPTGCKECWERADTRRWKI